MSNLFYAFIVGLVQGVAEWLPISSKTQVLFVSQILFGLPLNVGLAFGLFMEIGSLGSASYYFRREILSLLHDRKLLVYLIVVTAVTAVEGVPLYLIAEKLLTGAYNLGLPMIVLGAFLIGDSVYIRYSRAVIRNGDLDTMGMKHYIIIGAAQGFAALPGVSRSGMTVSTMLFMGVNPKDAFRLSYLAYIPASIGAFLTTLVFSKAELKVALSNFDVTGLAVAIVTAFLIGIFSISALLRFAKRNDIYKVTLALGTLAVAIGVLAAVGSI